MATETAPPDASAIRAAVEWLAEGHSIRFRCANDRRALLSADLPIRDGRAPARLLVRSDDRHRDTLRTVPVSGWGAVADLLFRILRDGGPIPSPLPPSYYRIRPRATQATPSGAARVHAAAAFDRYAAAT
jgi:hypothetical protein